MFCRVYCASCNGIDAITVTVEVDITPGVSFNLVGLPDVAVKESLQRISGALGHYGFKIPGKRILVNMAPANIKKEGSAFDLAIAVGLLYASGQIVRQDGQTEISSYMRTSPSKPLISFTFPAVDSSQMTARGCRF